jgi:hypothetical protein
MTCSGMVRESSEREVRPFPGPGRAVGLGTLSGQPVRETIGFAAVRACRCLELSADETDWPIRFPCALEFLKTPLGGVCKGFEGKIRGIYTMITIIPRHAACRMVLCSHYCFANCEGTGS